MLNKPFVDAPRETGHARAGPSAQPNNVPYFERRPPPNQTAGPNAVAVPFPRSAVASGRAPPVSPDGVVENDAAAPPTRRSSVQSVQLPPPPARIINKLQIRPHSIRRQSLPRHRVFPKPPHPAWEPPPPPSVPSEKKHSGPDTQLDSLHIKSHPNPEQRILRIVSELHRPYGRAKPGADPVDVHRAVPPTSRLKFHEIRKQDPVQLLFFRAFNGRPVVYGRPVKFNRCWTSREFAHELEAHYYHRWWFFRAVKPTRIKFVYFVAIGTETRGSHSTIWARYRDIIQYEGSRTLRYFTYVLQSARTEKENYDSTLTHNLLRLRDDMNGETCEKYILVEIIEHIAAQVVLGYIVATIALSIAAAVVYGYFREDWAGSFSLGALVAAWVTLVLGTFAAWEYLGLEKLLDDEIESRTGIWRYDEPSGRL